MIPEALTAGATLAGAALDYYGTRQASSEQMKFQREMSNTAYQRQVEDLRKAGLNPAMVYNLGGASSPSGASFKTDVGDKLAGMVGSALQSKKVREEYELLKMQKENVRAQTAKALSDAQLSQAQTGYVQQQTQAQIYDNVGNKIEADIGNDSLGRGLIALKRIIPNFGSIIGQMVPKQLNKDIVMRKQ